MDFENVFQNCDFENLNFENYREKILDNIPKKYQYKYSISRSKLLIEFFNYPDYIVKIFLVDSSAPEIILRVYQEAKANSLEQFFVEYVPFSTTKKAFYQKKVEVAQHTQIIFEDVKDLDLVQKLLQSTLLTSEIYKNLEFYSFYYKWLEILIETVGYDKAKDLLNFIVELGIVDIFSPTNYGFFNNIPVIFDYDDCSRKIKRKALN